jgi:hypothetical protein
MTTILDQFRTLEVNLDRLTKKTIDERIMQLERDLIKQIDQYTGSPLVLAELKAEIDKWELIKKPTEEEKQTLNTYKMELIKQENQLNNTKRYIRFYEDMIQGFKGLRKSKGYFSK